MDLARRNRIEEFFFGAGEAGEVGETGEAVYPNKAVLTRSAMPTLLLRPLPHLSRATPHPPNADRLVLVPESGVTGPEFDSSTCSSPSSTFSVASVTLSKFALTRSSLISPPVALPRPRLPRPLTPRLPRLHPPLATFDNEFPTVPLTSSLDASSAAFSALCPSSPASRTTTVSTAFGGTVLQTPLVLPVVRGVFPTRDNQRGVGVMASSPRDLATTSTTVVLSSSGFSRPLAAAVRRCFAGSDFPNEPPENAVLRGPRAGDPPPVTPAVLSSSVASAPPRVRLVARARVCPEAA